MRIIVNGQQAFGKACLDAIVEKGADEVVAVYAAPRAEGARPDPIEQAALDHGLPLRQPADYADPAVLDELRAWDADLMALAYVTLFVPRAARDIPKHGTICFHPSLLPLHRGPSSINWPIIWGAEKTGLTVFWPDDGLDEGDVLLRKEVAIGPDDTLGKVYFERIFPLGVAAMLEAVDLVRAGNAPRLPQDESKATYESWCRAADARIDWARSAGEVYNLVRGCDPQPGAWTTLDGETLQIFDCERAEGSGRVGRICAVDAESFTVAAGRGGIRVRRVRLGKNAKAAAADLVAERGLKVGARLGT